ncbi:Protein of unknown function, putative, partial [Plasmodium vivax]
FCISLENMYKQNKTWNTKFNRLLETKERQSKLKQSILREKLPDKRSCKEKSNVSPNISTYSHVKRNGSNNIDVYMKNYKDRYGKKKGLYKLDCYYENKIFKKIDYIYDLEKRMRNDRKSFKKNILQKFGFPLIFFTLIPFCGIVFPIIFNGYIPIVNVCYKGHEHTNTCKDYLELLFTKEQWKIFVPLYTALLSLLTILVLSIYFYILIKVLKYERLKCGKGKMSIKEYSCLCRDIF